MDTEKVCPICQKGYEDDDDTWYEFEAAYHISCIKEKEGKDKAFHENYQGQKRLKAKQVLEVLDLLHDKNFVEYWIHICCTEDEQDKLYDHPILFNKNNKEGLDLFP